MKEREVWTSGAHQQPAGHQDETSSHDTMHSGNMGSKHYGMFAVHMLLGLAIMYIVMFTMIDSRADFRNNLNMLYMAVTMAAPMGVVMLLTMRGMYRNKALNLVLHGILAVLTIASFAATRTQAAIGDRQFIASMVPHHSGAILMCREAQLADPKLIDLCGRIARSQRSEIEEMNAIRARLEGTG